MLVLGLDFETTGVNPKEDRVIEVGMALWDTVRKKPIRQTDFLVHPGKSIPQETWDEIFPINGISLGQTEDYGLMQGEAIHQIAQYISHADAVVAHNGTMFDKLFLEAWWNRYPECYPGERLWIDTRLDLPEPMIGSLICIAAKKGFLNPFPHQALSDVLTMMKILDSYDMDAVLARAAIPNIMVEFVGPFESKEHAKECGFYWNGYKEVGASKQWLKTIKSCDFETEDQAARPYRIREVKER